MQVPDRSANQLFSPFSTYGYGRPSSRCCSVRPATGNRHGALRLSPVKTTRRYTCPPCTTGARTFGSHRTFAPRRTVRAACAVAERVSERETNSSSGARLRTAPGFPACQPLPSQMTHREGRCSRFQSLGTCGGHGPVAACPYHRRRDLVISAPPMP